MQRKWWIVIQLEEVGRDTASGVRENRAMYVREMPLMHMCAHAFCEGWCRGTSLEKNHPPPPLGPPQDPR